MTYRPTLIAMAVAMAALAGFVDALAYIDLGGFFASFMSGNTTHLGVGLATGMPGDARLAAALILAFVAGVVIASVVAKRFAAAARFAVMLTVTIMLALAAALSSVIDRQYPLLLLASAMGAENAALHKAGDISLGLTYVTGTLVRFGEALAAALIGDGDRFGWLPYLVMWIGFAGGAWFGAHLHESIGSRALWAATAGAALLSLVAAAVAPKRAEG